MCKQIDNDNVNKLETIVMGRETLSMEEDFKHISMRCSEEECESLKAFAARCADFMPYRKGNWKGAECRIEKLAEAAGLHVSTTNTGGFCKKAMWVIYLKFVRNNLSDEDADQYPTLEALFEKYKYFKSRDVKEQHKLLQTANWMHRYV